MTETSDRSLVTDICLVNQSCSAVTVAFSDDAVADFFDAQVDAGLRLDQFGRIWVHTHPGNSPQPSGTDEETFARVFGSCDWALMFILAQGGATYARLRFNAGPGGELCLPVEVDYRQSFPAANQAAWEAEYERCVHAEHIRGFWPYGELESSGRRNSQTAKTLGPEFLFDEPFLEWPNDFE